MAAPQYRYQHEQDRRRLLASEPECVHCGAWPATVADHQPAIALHDHRPGWACCELVPSCKRCSAAQGMAVRRQLEAARRRPVPRVWAL